MEEDEKENEPKKDSLEDSMRVRNKIMLRNQEERQVNNLQWGYPNQPYPTQSRSDNGHKMVQNTSETEKSEFTRK